ncbi:MAG TPA: hypothetical protein VJP85_01160 [Candidatus Baltobacteraceae bacterium]|nr:hypothetical protein [Candidatus Baltobacteraceae bacterium]
MRTRKEFLAAAAAIPLVGAAPSPQPGAAVPAPTQTPAPNKRKISEAAKALAARMRTFDSHLSDEQLEKIAAGIDDNLKTGASVNPHGGVLKNWDEPVTVFEVSS